MRREVALFVLLSASAHAQFNIQLGLPTGNAPSGNAGPSAEAQATACQKVLMAAEDELKAYDASLDREALTRAHASVDAGAKCLHVMKNPPRALLEARGELASRVDIRERTHDETVAKRTGAAASKAKQDFLQTAAVVARLPTFKPDDSYDVSKIAAAFEAMTRADLVVTSSAGATDVFSAPFVYMPGPRLSSAPRVLREAPADAKHGSHVDWAFNDDTVFGYALTPLAKMPEGMPGFVWNIDSGRVVFVTLDGGRYVTDEAHLQAASGAVSVPKELLHDALPLASVNDLVTGGHAPAAWRDDIAKALTAGEACSTKVSNAAKGEFAAIKVANITESTRKNRYDAVRSKLFDKQKKTCAAQKNAYAKAVYGAADARAKQRQTLLKAMQTKFGG